jgi:hypothetical protein
VGLLAGPPGCGKTWLMLDLAVAVALARRWLGRFVCEQGAVLIVLEEEDAGGVVERMDLLLAGLGLSPEEGDTLPIHFVIQQGITLVTPEGTLDPELQRHIEEVKPSLLVLDPFRRLHGMEENDSAAMSHLFSLLRQLAAEYDCSILVVHHLRKRGEFDEGLDRLRGSSDIAASVDTVLEIGGQFGNQIVKHSKAKRGPSSGTWLAVADISTDAVRIRYMDRDIKKEIDQDALRGWLLDTLEMPHNKTQLDEAGKARGYGKDRIRKMLDELLQAGEIREEKGPKNSTIYSLTDQSAKGARVSPTTVQSAQEREECDI